MRIRRIGPDEWDLWREIRLEALRSDPAEFGSVLEREERYDEATWRQALATGAKVIAEDPDPVALVASLPEEEGLYLYSMWVRATHRGQGVGAALVREILDYAREEGSPTVRLRVWEENHGARRLYERMGFVRSDGDNMICSVAAMS